jgi:hypothetical protein
MPPLHPLLWLLISGRLRLSKIKWFQVALCNST